jgi:ribonuclease J
VAERAPAGHEPPVTVLMAENGDVHRFTADTAHIAEKAPAGRVLIDGTRTGEVGDEVLRDRRHLSGDGVLVPVVAINRQTGALEGEPDVISRGVVMSPGSDELIRESVELIRQVVGDASVEERTDPGLVKEKIRVELRRFFRKRSGRRPLVVPVIMEI